METPEKILLPKHCLDQLETLRAIQRDSPELFRQIVDASADEEDFDAPISDVLTAYKAFPEKTYQELRDLVERNGIYRGLVKTLVSIRFPLAKQLDFAAKFPRELDSDYCCRDDFGNEVVAPAIEKYLREHCCARRVFVGDQANWVVDMKALYEGSRDSYVVAVEARTFCRYKVEAASPADATKIFDRLTPAEREAALVSKSDTYEICNVER